MFTKRFYILLFLALTLLPLPLATASFTISNGSSTEAAWVAYSTYRTADSDYPAGFRTRGWYKVDPGATRTLWAPENNTNVYIYVQRGGSQVRPPDASTRESFLFWGHRQKAFTAVMNHDGSLRASNLNSWELERLELYTYRNGGHYTIAAGRSSLSTQEIWDQAIESVLWIYNPMELSEGSGFLIDEERQLAVTNQHVVGDAGWVYVCFPVWNQNRQLIINRDYYMRDYRNLALRGDGSWARVIATDEERDLAILQLNFVRENTREINHDFTTDLSLELAQGDRLHVLGNPGRYHLWQWTPGDFEYPILGNPVEGSIQRWTPGLSRLEDTDWLKISASIYGGNSGGPVLNSNGELVGVITSSDEETTSSAAPVRYVKELLDTVLARPTIQISNANDFSVSYELKWSASDDWSQTTVRPYGTYRHWWNGAVASGYPKIRFNSSGVSSWGADKSYTLPAFLRYFGNNYSSHVSEYDVEGYYFYYYSSTRKLDLHIAYDESEGCGQASDANGDGETNLQDLEFIESRIGWRDPGKADVDGDGDADMADMIYAAGLACNAFAAPSLMPADLTPTITAERVQRWIDEGKALGLDEPTYQRGIAALENLLAIIKQTEAIPKENALLPNYPNPFNPETWIPYELSEPATVTVTIYAADGQVVRELTLGQQPAGIYQNKSRAAYWDGKNAFGEPVATGVYFYRLQAGEFTATRKMVIRK